MRLWTSSLTKQLSAFLVIVLIALVAGCSSPEEKAQAYYKQGEVYLKAGEYTKAGLEFRNAIQLNEKLVGAWSGLAKVAEHDQNARTMHTALQRVVELDPKNFDATLKLARLLLAGGAADKALELANAANKLKKDNTDALALRAAVLLRLNDREGARANAEKALSINPDNPDAHAVLAVDQLKDNHLVAAMQFVDRGLSTDQNNLGLLLLKLKILEQQKNNPKIESVLRRLIVAHPKNKAFRLALVKFLVSQKRTDDAETEMRAMVAADPADTTAALRLVQFIGAAKGPDAGRKELEKLIAASPDVVDYKLAMAQLDFSQSKNEAATAILNAIIAKGEPLADVGHARLLLARNFLKHKNTEKAASLVDTVLSADPKNADALALRAAMRLDAGKIDQGIADVREALNQVPRSVPLMQLLAKAYERQGSISLANDQYGQAYKAANNAPAAALVYARFLAGRGDWQHAESVLSDSASRYPGNVALLQALGQARLHLHDWAGAQSVAEAIKKLGDKSGASAQLLGSALMGEKKFSESIDVFKSAYSESPQAVRPMYSLVLAYLRAGQLQDASAFIKSVLEANPDNAEANVLQGALDLAAKEPVKAEASYREAIKKQPDNALGYTSLANLYIAQKNFDKAEAAVREGILKAPHNFGLQLALGGVLEIKGDFEGAIAQYDSMLKDWPDSLIVINNFASLVADHRDDKASLDQAGQLATRLANVDVPQFKDTLGWLAFRRGDYSSALENLRLAVEKLPNVALVHYHLGRTYAALGSKDDAQKEFDKATKLLPQGDPLHVQIQKAVAELRKPPASQN